MWVVKRSYSDEMNMNTHERTWILNWKDDSYGAFTLTVNGCISNEMCLFVLVYLLFEKRNKYTDGVIAQRTRFDWISIECKECCHCWQMLSDANLKLLHTVMLTDNELHDQNHLRFCVCFENTVQTDQYWYN